MKLNFSISLIVLGSVFVLGFQNCSPYAVDPNLVASASSSPNISPATFFDAAYTDGLAIGTTQTGALFARDPSSASGNDRLSFAVDLSPYVVQTTIKHLDGSQAYLTDGFVKFSTMDVSNSTYSSTPVAVPNSPLIYPETDGRFQQVNAYYHADRLIADLKGQNLFPSNYTAIDVYARCSDATNNAYYDYTNHFLCLGYTSATPRVWAADDTDVVTHEFGHSLNHTFSTDAILSSTSEMGALDEAFADLWAYRNSGDPRVSRWYGRALDSRTGTGPYLGLRNLDNTLQYPSAVDYEIHDDSRMISSVIKAVEANANMDQTTLAKFEKHLVESIQMGHGFGDVIAAIQDEGTSLGIDQSIVTGALNARGLYRKDLISEISLDSTKPFYIIDNHDAAETLAGSSADSNLQNGNCNGALDSGETALFFPNLRNSGALKGSIKMNLVSNTSGVTILSGGDYGFLARIPANTTYLAGEMGSYSASQKYEFSSDYGTRLYPALMYIRASAGFSGTANLTLTVTSMNTVDSTSQSKDIPFTITVGTAANQSACSSTTVDRSMYP